jgi:hypothetical protein
MGYQGWRPVGDPVTRLCDSIDECEQLWGNDPAYKDVLFKLDQVEQDLEHLSASPGHRAALRAATPNIGGQDPSNRQERPSEAEKGSSEKGY